MKRFLISTMMIGAFALASAANAGAINVFLDKDHQGEGNKGLSFRPVDEFGDPAGFVMTAMSSIDGSDPFSPFASGLDGTVYIDRDGAGVQSADAGGSKGISGGGPCGDEQLIFAFDMPAMASSFQLGLVQYEAGNGLGDKDDTILFINFVGSSDILVLDETEYMSAFTSTGDKAGYIDFSMLGFGDALIESLTVREIKSHMEVNAMSYALVPLPAPLALGLFGLAGVALMRKRRGLARSA